MNLNISEPELLGLAEALVSLIAYPDPVEWILAESYQHLPQLSKLEKIRLLQQIANQLEFSNQEHEIKPIRQDYLPYNDDYLLVRKQAVLVNGAAFERVCHYVSEIKGCPPNDVMEQAAYISIALIARLSKEELNNSILKLFTDSWRASSNPGPTLIRFNCKNLRS